MRRIIGAIVLLVVLMPSSVRADFSCDNVTQVSAGECEALVSIYQATNGNHWRNKTNWLKTTTVCSWYGVICVGAGITSLVLQGNLMAGPLPEAIENLGNLEILNLQNNDLMGEIPASISHLGNLQELNLGNNDLSGGIPVEIGQIRYLRVLNLHTNNLMGRVPLTVGKLRELQVLYLSDTQLAGPLPITLLGIPLQMLRFDSTDLCEPSNGEFQRWLSELDDLRTTGVVCPGGSPFVSYDYVPLVRR